MNKFGNQSKLLIALLAALGLSKGSANVQTTNSVVGFITTEREAGSHLIGSPFSANSVLPASALEQELLGDFWPAGTLFSH